MNLGKRLLYCIAMFVGLVVYGVVKHGTDQDFEFIVFLSFYISALLFCGLTWKKQIKSVVVRINNWASDYNPWKMAVMIISIIIGSPIIAFILFIPFIIVVVNFF